eukprot:scaffold7554_cov143-Skeletonema_menzelii.AAC.3
MPAGASKSKKSKRQAARGRGRELSSNSKALSKISDYTAETTTPPKDRGPNVIILSSAGKPIFVRHGGDEDNWSSACGLLQGLRANVLSFDDVDSSLGEIQSIRAGNTLIVFLNTKALMLVAISDGENGSQSEGWLRLQLEYTYAQVIFTLTDQIQSIFEQSPSYDLRTMMGPNVDASLRNLLDQFDHHDSDEGKQCETDISASSYSQGAATFLTAGVECVFPLNPELRDSTSQLLIDTCRGDNTLFALLVVGTRLVTIVQPSNPTSQLHTSDLHLIMTFVGRQPGLLTNELWFPVCLPRFDSSGFLYAYTSCLDPVHTGLSIVLISGNNSTEQFKVFHSAADEVRSNLGLPPIGSVRSSMSSKSSTGDDKETATNWSDIQDDSDSDYDDDNDRRDSILSRISASGKRTSGQGIAPRPLLGERQLSMTNYLTHNPRPRPKAAEQKETTQDGPFVTALKIALLPQQEDIMSQYLELASAVHFTFRCDIYVQGSSETSTEGMLTQCFGPPLSFPFTDIQSQRKVWDVYQRLSLRLRLGSSSVETCYDALDMFQGHGSSNNLGDITNDCPMQALLESPPNVHGVTYLQEDNEWLYVGLNGKFFELYATLPATVKPREGTAYCARLVRKLMGDERILFLSNPLTWNS